MLDFDGTLVNSEKVVNDALAALIQKHHFSSVTPKQLKHKQAKTVFGKLRLLLFMLKIKNEFKELYGQNIHRIEFYDDIYDVLMKIRNGQQRVVVLSSNDTKNIINFFSLHNVRCDAITVLSTKGLFGKHKTIQAYIKESRVDASSILYIGDELRDVQACNKAGVDIAFANWGADADQDLSAYDVKCILKEPSDLIEIAGR